MYCDLIVSDRGTVDSRTCLYNSQFSFGAIRARKGRYKTRITAKQEPTTDDYKELWFYVTTSGKIPLPTQSDLSTKSNETGGRRNADWEVQTVRELHPISFPVTSTYICYLLRI